MLSAMESNCADGHSSPHSRMLPPKSCLIPSKPDESHFVSPTSSAASVGGPHSDHSKRGRREEQSESSDDSTAPVQPALQSPKKTRCNTYIAPRTVPNSFINSMGTLVAPVPAAPSGGSSNLRVHMRRQLSGGKIESFLGDHDAMDVDTTSESTRPRSMSF